MSQEVSHYVVTAHPPGGVLRTVKCNFLAPDSEDVIIAKSRRLEIRQLLTNHPNVVDAPSPFPVILSEAIHGRITAMVPIQVASHTTSLLFVMTDQYQYAVIGYHQPQDNSSNINSNSKIQTYCSGQLQEEGKWSESGPLVAVDPHSRCLVVHVVDGLVTIFPLVATSSILGAPYSARLEERTLLSMCLLHHVDPTLTPPHLCLLHQDSRGAQHISTHVVDLPKSQLWSMTSYSQQPQVSQGHGHGHGHGAGRMHTEWLKKSRIDGGSSLIIPVPPRPPAEAAAASNTSSTSTPLSSGGVVILGQRQITFCALNHYKVMPIPPSLILSWDVLPNDVSGMPRYLLGDEFGNLHMLTLITNAQKVMALQLDTLGSCCTLPSALQYLTAGLVFCGSTLGDSQLVQIHDEPIPVEEEDMEEDGGLELGDTTYLSVVEEYTHLGPIVDFDLVPMASEQSQVVTASGSSKSGSLRLIRNGIGMKEYASVELSGIQNMWSLRRQFDDSQDSYLVQSFVGETRVLGVTKMEDEEAMETTNENDDNDPMEEEEGEVGGSLEEVVLPGLESKASTLFVTNVIGNLFLQITESQIRLVCGEGEILDVHSPQHSITVAAANEAGQIVVALRGGMVLLLEIVNAKLQQLASQQMDREVSCLNIHPFSFFASARSNLVAVGLWDDFTVRLLSLPTLTEVLQIHLSAEAELEQDEITSPQDNTQRNRSNRNNMMARSLCLITLDFNNSGNNNSSNSVSNAGVNMLFVGLGDGTLASFAVVEEHSQVQVQSKKEVSLGTQRIHLVPLFNPKGGTCVLATGDRPTVIYLAGASQNGRNYNPKLCYSNVNLSPVEDDGEENEELVAPQQQSSIAVNVAAPFFSPLLFADSEEQTYSLCVADDSFLRLGVIDDIQKLHVTTCRLGMAPRRIVHCPEGRLFAVGCIESGIKQVGVGGGEMTMGNCIRFLDDTTFDDLERIDLEPCEMVLSMVSVSLKVVKPCSSSDSKESTTDDTAESEEYKPYLIVGTAYALHDEDEPTKGRILVLSCAPSADDLSRRHIRTVTELQVRGGVYSTCQFYNGTLLVTVNSKTQLCQLVNEEGTGVEKLVTVGVGHHGHILSLFVTSRANPKLLGVSAPEPKTAAAATSTEEPKENPKSQQQEEQLAIVGDLMRSISLVQYYPQHETLEEVARDFNANWTTAVAMLTDNVYLGGENWNNLFVLRRNTKAQSEEVRCRLDTVGEFHLGEMCNKFMSGSLVMPSTTSTGTNANGSSNPSSGAVRRALTSPMKASTSEKMAAASPGGTGTGAASASATRSKRPNVIVGSQTLFGTVDGTLGVILGLDGPTTAFFSCLERSMQRVISPIGNFSHQQFRAFTAEQRLHPSHGFVDGDLVESFLDLDRTTMKQVIQQMNRDGGWEIDDSAFAATGGTIGDKATTPANSNVGMEDDQRPELSVEDVLAVVEEMTMLH